MKLGWAACVLKMRVYKERHLGGPGEFLAS